MGEQQAVKLNDSGAALTREERMLLQGRNSECKPKGTAVVGRVINFLLSKNVR